MMRHITDMKVNSQRRRVLLGRYCVSQRWRPLSRHRNTLVTEKVSCCQRLY